MKTILPVLLILISHTLMFAGDNAAKRPKGDTVFREPFTLELYLDQSRKHKQKIPKTPYVLDGKIYLLKGDDFGVDLEIEGNSIRSMKYQPDLKKADVTFNFTQEVEPDGMTVMFLRIHNDTKHTLAFDALMTVPGKKEATKAKVLPVPPGISGLESWFFPIVQLVLSDTRIAK